MRELLAYDRSAELVRGAERRRLARAAKRAAAERPRRTIDDLSVALRLERVSDRTALVELAALDGRALPAGPLVVAERKGRIVAALPVAGGPGISDPFVPTRHIVPLLELRADQIRRLDGRWSLRRRLLLRRA
jgi:hypothetical protein